MGKISLSVFLQYNCTVMHDVKLHSTLGIFRLTAGSAVFAAFPLCIGWSLCFQFNALQLLLVPILLILKGGAENGFLRLAGTPTSNKHIVHCTSKVCWLN
jgi:hypothetical protein